MTEARRRFGGWQASARRQGRVALIFRNNRGGIFVKDFLNPRRVISARHSVISAAHSTEREEMQPPLIGPMVLGLDQVGYGPRIGHISLLFYQNAVPEASLFNLFVPMQGLRTKKLTRLAGQGGSSRFREAS